MLGLLSFSSFTYLFVRLGRSCFSNSLWKVIEFLGGEMDWSIFMASLKLSMKDLSGEYVVSSDLPMT